MALLKREMRRRASINAAEVPGMEDKRQAAIRAAELRTDAVLGRRPMAGSGRRGDLRGGGGLPHETVETEIITADGFLIVTANGDTIVKA